MVCVLCDKLITSEKRKLIIKAKEYSLHKVCLRKATQKQLIEKGLINPDDKAWWSRLG